MARKKHPDRQLHNANAFEDMQGMMLLSGNYFNAAEDLRQLAWKDKKSDANPHSWHTYPAIIMFATSLEVFINENSSQDLRDITLSKEKVSAFVTACRPDIELEKCTWYQDILALIVIRNELVHYAPIMRGVTMCPNDIREAMLRSKVKLCRQSGYLSNLGNPSFADWAFKGIKRFGVEVSKSWWPGNNRLMTSKEYTTVMESLS